MKVYINHSPVEAGTGISLSDLLSSQGISTEGTAAAVNNKVVPRADWDSTMLEEGAKVTVIRAVCGG